MMFDSGVFAVACSVSLFSNKMRGNAETTMAIMGADEIARHARENQQAMFMSDGGENVRRVLQTELESRELRLNYSRHERTSLDER